MSVSESSKTCAQAFETGLFGPYGGQFVPETLMTAVIELDKAYREAKEDSSFQAELDDLLKNYVGRETPLYHAKRLTDHIGGAQIYLKREDLNHTGAHKINNALGQVLLAKRMGKKKIIAETGAGQHGVATATAAALFDMDCTIYMGEEDVKRQYAPRYEFKSVNKKYVVQQIMHYMETHYKEKISLDQIAANMYLSSFYISKIFKSETGDTPINYLISLRMQKARELLDENPEQSIQAVAMAVGYEDAYHFSKLFKKYFGLSPLYYKARIPQ